MYIQCSAVFSAIIQSGSSLPLSNEHSFSSGKTRTSFMKNWIKSNIDCLVKQATSPKKDEQVYIQQANSVLEYRNKQKGHATSIVSVVIQNKFHFECAKKWIYDICGGVVV